MKKIYIEKAKLTLPNIVVGCMRYAEKRAEEVRELICTAMENGLNFFDHADIYGGDHESERIFAKAVQMSPYTRDKFILQTKCGIVPGNFHYDFSKEHIIESVDGSLKALNTDYVDILLLHRPDILVEPSEVAEAFEQLHKQGKVRAFGVSNHTPMQTELLKSAVKYPILFNQLQLSAVHTLMFDHGVSMNLNGDQSADRTGSVVEYCRLNGITVQAWSPFQKGLLGGTFMGDPSYEKLNAALTGLAKDYGVTPSAIAVAFITRHPANMQVVLGTTNVNRLIESSKGSDIPLTREEWYEIYKSAGKTVP